jgi:hypothetical protein
MQIWSCGQLVAHPCFMFSTGIISVLELDSFPVARSEENSDCQHLSLFCSFLGLFAPVHAQDVQIRSTAHRVLPVAFLLLEQYHSIIPVLRKQQ